MKYLNYLILLSSILLFQACNEDTVDPFILNSVSDYKGDVALDWVNLQRTLVKTNPGYSPPVAARAYAYASLAMYESVVPGIKDHKSYSGLISAYNGQGIPVIETGKNYNWELVANASMAYMLRNQFPNTPANQSQIDSLEQLYITKNNTIDPAVASRSVAFGVAAATAVYNFSKTDNMDQAHTANFPTYTVPVGPGKWEPTAPNQKPLQPYWGDVRPFLAANVENSFVSSFQNIPFSTDPKSLFYLEANEVYITGLNLSPEKTMIARFWSDDPGLTSTPPGHSMSITAQVLKTENADLAESAEVLSKVGLAVHDGFVSCWKCKYVVNLLRPVTYIKAYIDPNYATLLPTPPFPEHTSGHSVQTSASMTVLEHYYGSNYSITDNTHGDRTDFMFLPRTFRSFADITNEAAISRLYGGIHFRAAIDQGKDQGRVIGRNIASIPLQR